MQFPQWFFALMIYVALAITGVSVCALIGFLIRDWKRKLLW